MKRAGQFPAFSRTPPKNRRRSTVRRKGALRPRPSSRVDRSNRDYSALGRPRAGGCLSFPGRRGGGRADGARKPGHEEAYPEIVEREEAASLSSSTRDPVTWARRKKMRSTSNTCIARASRSSGRAVGDGNVVLRRDLPTGIGERPSSHTPASRRRKNPKKGRGRLVWDSSRTDPTNEGPHGRSPVPVKKRRKGKDLFFFFSPQ